MSNRPRNDSILIFYLGFLLLLAVNGVVALLLWLAGPSLAAMTGQSVATLWAMASLTIFLWQWLYVLPLMLWLRKRNQSMMANGVLFGALINILLNGAGACFAVLFGIP
jgi:hypothetical protein